MHGFATVRFSGERLVWQAYHLKNPLAEPLETLWTHANLAGLLIATGRAVSTELTTRNSQLSLRRLSLARVVE